MIERDISGRHDGHDRLVDATLQDVPVPMGIAGRMAVDALFDDAAIDRLLAGVSAPAGLAPRVRRGLADVVDERLPRPAVAPGRGGPCRRGAALRMLGDLLLDGAAVVAVLAIVVGMFMAGTALSRRLAPAATAGRDASPQAAPAVAKARPSTDVRTGRPAPRAAAHGAAVVAAAPPEVASDFPPSSPASRRGGDDEQMEPVPVPAEGRRASVRAAAPLTDPVGPAVRPGRGAAVRTVLLPEATRRVPQSAGYDIAFEMAHGEAPFIDPRAAGLEVDRPPLAVRCDTFDMLSAGLGPVGRAAAARSRRAAAVPRVEEFLAAVSPPTPADTAAAAEQAGVRLSVGAVRSLRASPESLLVELCATALPPVDGPPLDALVVVDQSSGPGAAVAWQWACRGLARIAALMRDDDRVSVVVCGERPRLAALRVAADGLTLLAEELRREPPAAAADIDAGLRLVADVARREGPPGRIVVLAHAGSLEQCRGEGRAAVAAWQAARAGTVERGTAGAVEFVRVDPQQPVAERPAADSGGVDLDGVAVVRELVARVLDRPTLVAGGCRMEVRFDPGAVAAYRIVGHRQTAADVLSAGATPALDLHLGETVRVVYEVVRRPGRGFSAAQEMVTAILRWTPAAGGGEVVARIGLVAGRGVGSGDDPRVSQHASELLLAMGLGEWLAGSVHAEPRRQFAAAIAGLSRACRDRGGLAPALDRLVAGVEQEGILRADAAGR